MFAGAGFNSTDFRRVASAVAGATEPSGSGLRGCAEVFQKRRGQQVRPFDLARERWHLPDSAFPCHSRRPTRRRRFKSPKSC